MNPSRITLVLTLVVIAGLALAGPIAAGEGDLWRAVSLTEAAFSGRWLDSVTEDARFGEEKVGDRQAAYVEFTFTGTGVRWVGSAAPNRGMANVYLDDELVAEGVDLYREEHVFQEVLFERTGLEEGTHTLKVDPISEKSERSTMALVSIDHFQYIPTLEGWWEELSALIDEYERLAQAADNELSPYYPNQARELLASRLEEARAVLDDEDSGSVDIHAAITALEGTGDDLAEMATVSWTAVRTDTPPEVDARFEGPWDRAETFMIDENITAVGGTIITLEPNPGLLPRWSFHLLWDEEHLYFFARVQDDDPHFIRAAGEPLNSLIDTVQICFEPANKRAKDNTHLYILDLSISGDGEPINYEHFQHEAMVEEVEMAADMDDEGYTIEAAIPWAIYEDLEAVGVGDEFPFGIIIIDSGPEADNVFDLTMDFGEGENRIGAPYYYNTLTLVD